MAPVDLRSDTVTRPSPAMRRAMAEAEVGDAEYDDDPSVNRLQEQAAETMGTEAAIYLVTGTMCNQVALHVLARTGHEVSCVAGSHIASVESPASDATPGYIPADARRMARSAGVTCKVWPARALEQAGFGGIVGVGRGSPHEPQMVELTYKGAGARTKPIAITGKGVTFDSGGLDLKKPDEMAWMRSDMAGGAAALATVRAVAELGLKVNVIAAIPFAENMPGPGALRPGDVVTHRGGLTSEVIDTDAEGRVLLADALAFLTERRPAVILDSATLTDASGLGPDLWAGMGTDRDTVMELVEAGREAGDAGWEIPLWTRYRPIIDSDYADVKNQGAHGRDSAMLAGLFLRDFVADDVPWVHVDTGSAAWAEHENPPWPGGATGSPTRAFVRFIEQREAGG